MGMLDKAGVTRRMCPVIFLLDTSGSMAGSPIGAVNAAMEGVLPELISMNDENTDAEINVAVLSFDTAAKWVTNGLVDPGNFGWNDLNPGGGTSMGAAFKELDTALSVSKGFMNRASGSVAPVLFLLSDGGPTDSYKEHLQKLQNNNWYKVAARVAIGYGSNSNDAILAEFTGNTETVLHTNDPKDLKNMIRFVTITSSMVASKGSAVAVQDNNANAPADPNDATSKLVQEFKKNPPTLATDDEDDDW